LQPSANKRPVITPKDSGVTRTIGFAGDAEALVKALRDGQPAAIAAFYDRYAERVWRVLVRILGRDQELDDVHHEAFLRALGAIRSVENPARLDAWITSVAVHTAKTCLQRRYRRRWLVLVAPADLGELDVRDTGFDPAIQPVLEATYRVLDRLAPRERLVFTLRFIQGMQLGEVAEACGISLATAKRRLKLAEQRFMTLAREQPVLAEWIREGLR
jgi:RNA polymerase sigma-70 factor, ECF subfamily